MKHWPVQDAKARFSEMLKASLDEGPQMVTLRGKEAAVLVPVEEWRRLKPEGRLSIKELLLAPEPKFDIPLPSRKRYRRRRFTFED